MRADEVDEFIEQRNRGERRMVREVTVTYEMQDLQCPSCGTLFSVLASDLEEADKIACPSCFEKTKVSDLVDQDEDQLEDQDEDVDEDQLEDQDEDE